MIQFVFVQSIWNTPLPNWSCKGQDSRYVNQLPKVVLQHENSVAVFYCKGSICPRILNEYSHRGRLNQEKTKLGGGGGGKKNRPYLPPNCCYRSFLGISQKKLGRWKVKKPKPHINDKQAEVWKAKDSSYTTHLHQRRANHLNNDTEKEERGKK